MCLIPESLYARMRNHVLLGVAAGYPEAAAINKDLWQQARLPSRQ